MLVLFGKNRNSDTYHRIVNFKTFKDKNIEKKNRLKHFLFNTLAFVHKIVIYCCGKL